MNNKQFESTNLMTNKQIFNQFQVFVIEGYVIKHSGFESTFFYIIDKKIRVDEYTKIVVETDNFYIFETDYDGTPRQLKGFKTKEFAQEQLEKRKQK